MDRASQAMSGLASPLGQLIGTLTSQQLITGDDGMLSQRQEIASKLSALAGKIQKAGKAEDFQKAMLIKYAKLIGKIDTEIFNQVFEKDAAGQLTARAEGIQSTMTPDQIAQIAAAAGGIGRERSVSEIAQTGEKFTGDMGEKLPGLDDLFKAFVMITTATKGLQTITTPSAGSRAELLTGYSRGTERPTMHLPSESEDTRTQEEKITAGKREAGILGSTLGHIFQETQRQGLYEEGTTKLKSKEAGAGAQDIVASHIKKLQGQLHMESGYGRQECESTCATDYGYKFSSGTNENKRRKRCSRRRLQRRYASSRRC